jgi:hypothetical protein
MVTINKIVTAVPIRMNENGGCAEINLLIYLICVCGVFHLKLGTIYHVGFFVYGKKKWTTF